jgi:hypothetical protein
MHLKQNSIECGKHGCVFWITYAADKHQSSACNKNVR